MNRLYYLLYIIFISIFISAIAYNLFYIPSSEDTEFIYTDFSTNDQNSLALENHYHTQIKADRPNKIQKILQKLKTKTGDSSPEYSIGYITEAINNSTVDSSQRFYQFTERGPSNVSGSIRSIAFCPLDSINKVWVAGAYGGDIWRTTNNGKNWKSVTENLPNAIIGDIQYNTKDSSFFAITGETFGKLNIKNGIGLLKSTDFGETWNILPSTINDIRFQCINSMVIDAKDGNKILIGTAYQDTNKKFHSLILKTTDGGLNWEEVYHSNQLIQQLTLDHKNSNIIYATIKNSGIIKSINSGETWGKIGPNLPKTGRSVLIVSPFDSNVVITSFSGKKEKDGVLYLSNDGGYHWKKLQTNIETGLLGGQGWYNNTLLFHPEKETTFYVAGINIWEVNIKDFKNATADIDIVSDAYGEHHGPNQYISENGKIVKNGLHPDHHQLKMIKKGDIYRMISANDGGIYISDDINNLNKWHYRSGTINSTHFFGIDISPDKKHIIGGSIENGSWISVSQSDSLESFRNVLGGDGFDVLWHTTNRQKILVSIYNNNIYRSVDGGYNFKKSSLDIFKEDGRSPFITKMINDKANPDMVYALGENGIWISKNFGSTWKLSEIKNAWEFSDYMDLDVSIVDPNIIWAGSGHTEKNKIQVSTDKGKTFTPTSLPTNLNLGQISGIVTDPIEKETAYALFSFGKTAKILKSQDLGKNWEDLTGFVNSDSSTNGFPDVGVNDLLVFPFNNHLIWAATEIGIFESTNAGKSWHKLNSNIPTIGIWKLKYQKGEVLVSTQGRGIWSLSLNEGPQPKIITQHTLPDGQFIEFSITQSIDSIALIDQEGTILSDSIIALPKGNYQHQTEYKNQIKSDQTQLVVYKDGLSYRSNLKPIQTIHYDSTITSLKVDFNKAEELFSGDALVLKDNVVGFYGTNLHSDHYYRNNTTLFTYFKYPIKVVKENSKISYKDVALLSKDDDYVVLEGSNDGVHWVELNKPYNGTFNPDWRYFIEQKEAKGAQTLSVKHEINLLNFFKPDDEIIIRFKFNSDNKKPNWGWAVTSLEIQVDDKRDLPDVDFKDIFQVQSHIYPTEITNNKLYIEVLANNPKPMKLKVINLIGNTILERDNIQLRKGWNKFPLVLPQLNPGIYILNLEIDNKISTHRFVYKLEEPIARR
ncbi:T9SS type A sorting domain-containing protein [Flammeovirga sp. SubArs3]|uniref:VPS10 domain-containing protein n=1 Tax=Flammeovirga sp. SubArs3 TaxID=2995316 RepID=UPI00248D0C92|nr:T9SS type A sorting domain-containing protein [Flammeovirga sp. SubArs3]